MDVHFTDMILTIIVLSFWFMFPIGIFLSVAHVDKNTDQIVRLEHLRHRAQRTKKAPKFVKTRERAPHWQMSYRH